MIVKNRPLIFLCVAFCGSTASAAVKHKVMERDTLWDLAMRYYKDSFKWRKIAEANPSPNIRDPHWIYPGQILVIPDMDESPAETRETPAADSAEPPPSPAAPSVLPIAPPPAPSVELKSESAPGAVALPESLSTKLPQGLVTQFPSSTRLMALPGWKADGEVTEFEGRETMAAEGDLIDVRLEEGFEPRPRQRFQVFRRAAPAEADVNKDALYLTKVGIIALKRRIESGLYRATILKSNDALQLGDLIKREE